VPEMVALRATKYQHMGVICEEDTEKCVLVQREHTLNDFIYVVEEPKIIRFVV
jgi:hypothetical protein